MEKGIEAKLSFDGFKVVRSLWEVKGMGLPSENLNLEFDLNGVLDIKNNLFILNLSIHLFDEGTLNIEVESSANFTIPGSNIDNPTIENFLYLNAPAILFPYIRAYITSLTALSGMKSITIPIINMTNLKDQLKENTKKID